MTQHDVTFLRMLRQGLHYSQSGIQMSTGTSASLLKHKENIVLVIHISDNPSRMQDRGIVFYGILLFCYRNTFDQ